MTGVDPNLNPDVIAAEGSLVAIQRKVVEYLRAIPELANVQQIFIEDQMDLSSEIDKAISSGLLSICVSIGNVTDTATSVPGALKLDPCEIIIRCLEHPTVNRAQGGTGITRNRAGEIIAKALKLQQINTGMLHDVRMENSALPRTTDMIGRDIFFSLTIAI